MINIAYTIDVQGSGAVPFINQLLTSIYSIKKTKSENDDITIYILYANITAEVMENVNRFQEDHFKIAFKKIQNNDLSFMQQFTKQTPNSDSRSWCGIVYARLWLAKFLSKLNRVIYLDSDTMIRGSLQELYDFDLDGKGYGLVMGCIPEYGYNSGVILMDLEKIRSDNKWDALNDHLKNYAITYFLPDQTVINRFYKDDIKELPLKFNYPPYTNIPRNANGNCNSAIIWHFYNGGTKPYAFGEADWTKVEWNQALAELTQIIRE